MFRLLRLFPPHGWRAVWWELGIVTLGVLIALGAQQVVEAINWQAQVRAGREALRSDFKGIVMLARERQGMDACLRARLGHLVTLLNSSSGTLPALGHIGSPPGRNWYPASWDSLVAANVSTHMSRDDMLAYSSIAAQARCAEDTAGEEVYDWAKLYAMVGPGRKTDPVEVARLRETANVALFRLNLLRLISAQLERSVMEEDILSPEDFREIESSVTSSRSGPNWQATCNSIPPPSGRIIEAPYDPAIQKSAAGGDRAQ